MPNRIIREACRTSLSLSRLSHGAERLFWRLITVADDFGRFQAESELILATCYSRMLLKILTADILAWMDELIEQDIIRRYVDSGNEYAYFTNWSKYQDRRAKRSKYPHPPTSASTCSQMRADVPVSEDRGSYPGNVSVSESVSGDLAHANGCEQTPADVSREDLEKGEKLLESIGIKRPKAFRKDDP